MMEYLVEIYWKIENDQCIEKYQKGKTTQTLNTRRNGENPGIRCAETDER